MNLARVMTLVICQAMLDWENCPAVERSPDKVSGAWVFRGTRVPVKALFENLEAGAKVDDFLVWFEASPASRWMPFWSTLPPV